MRLSALRRVVVRGSDGQPVWKEVSQMFFPKGGKTLSFNLRSLFVFAGFLGFFCYAQIQNEINPQSKWGVYYRKLTEEPLKFLGFDSTDEKKTEA